MGVKVREDPKGSGRWYVFINHAGRRKSKYVGTQRAAKIVAEKISAKLTLGEFAIKDERKIPTFAEYRQRWMRDYVGVHCKHSTVKGYESVFKNHLAEFDTKRLDEITRQDISGLISRKIVEAKKSKGTVRNIIAPLREMFNHAIDEGILAANPANRIGRFVKQTSAKASRMKIDPFTREETAKLLENARQHSFDVYALLMCAVRTGMRMGELFGLEWGDLDFNSRFVQVQRSWVDGRIETPKSHQRRRIDMSKQLSETLQELRRRREILFFQVRAEAGQLRQDGVTLESDIPRILAAKYQRSPDGIRYIMRGEQLPEIVFANEEGGRLDHSAVRTRVFEKLLRKAELRKVRFHDLRHTFASLLLQQEESPQYVKEQMGHHSIQITVDIYGHLIPGTNRRAVDRLDERPAEARPRRSHAPARHAHVKTGLRIASRQN